MKEQRRYARPDKVIESEEHLLAFIDILGFKQFLLHNELDRLFRLFEEIADTIYAHRRQGFLFGLAPIEPRMTNFSDSIIMFAPASSMEEESVQQLRYGLFFDVCRGIIATSLRLGIPIRGAVSQGQFFVGEAESAVPRSVRRWGNTIIRDVLEQYGQEAVRPVDFENRVLPPIRIPVHMGSALTEAYLLESSVNSIGCFVSESIQTLPIVEYLAATDRVATHEVDGRSLLGLNWCNYWHFDTFSEIVAFANSQVTNDDPRVVAKWRSLLSFAESVPTR